MLPITEALRAVRGRVRCAVVVVVVEVASAAPVQGREAGEAAGVHALLEGLTQEGFLQEEGRMNMKARKEWGTGN